MTDRKAYLREYLARRRRKLLAAGACPECGSERDKSKLSLCAACRKKARAATAKYRRDHPEEWAAENRRAALARRKHRIEAGLCDKCGGERDSAALRCSKCMRSNRKK